MDKAIVGQPKSQIRPINQYHKDYLTDICLKKNFTAK